MSEDIASKIVAYCFFFFVCSNLDGRVGVLSSLPSQEIVALFLGQSFLGFLLFFSLCWCWECELSMSWCGRKNLVCDCDGTSSVFVLLLQSLCDRVGQLLLKCCHLVIDTMQHGEDPCMREVAVFMHVRKSAVRFSHFKHNSSSKCLNLLLNKTNSTPCVIA